MRDLSPQREFIHAATWLYEFPNGHTVSVIPDPRRPLRFEVLVDDTTHAGLTSEQAEELIRATANES